MSAYAITLNFKELVAINHALQRGMSIVQLLGLWNGIVKIPANMRPTAGARDSRQIIVALVAIRHEISGESFQESFGIVSGSGFRVSIEENHRKPIFTGTEEPHE